MTDGTLEMTEVPETLRERGRRSREAVTAAKGRGRANFPSPPSPMVPPPKEVGAAASSVLLPCKAGFGEGVGGCTSHNLPWEEAGRPPSLCCVSADWGMVKLKPSTVSLSLSLSLSIWRLLPTSLSLVPIIECGGDTSLDVGFRAMEES